MALPRDHIRTGSAHKASSLVHALPPVHEPAKVM